MTAVQPVTAPPGERLVPASCRVTLLVGDSHGVDLVLPAALPLAGIVDGAVDAVNRALRARGERELPTGLYEFARAGGMTALDMGVSLAGHGVRDGRDMLVLLPAGDAERYGPVVENISTGLARWAAQHFPPMTARDAALTGVALFGAALTLSAGLLWRARWAAPTGWWTGGVVLGAAVLIVAAAVVCRRTGVPVLIVNGIVWAAFTAAVLGAVMLPPGTRPGAPHALLGSVVGLVGVVVCGKTTRTRLIPAAIVTMLVPACGAAAARMLLEVPGQRIAITTLIGVLIASRIAPTVGLWMARVPRQPFGRITGEDIFAALPGQPHGSVSPVEPAPHDRTPSGQQIGELAVRSNRVLAGIVAGVAVVEVAGSVGAINPGQSRQWPFIAVTAVVALALLLRGRAFRHRWHAILTTVGAALSLYVIPAHYGLAAGGVRPALTAAAVILGIAAVGVAVGAVIPARHFAPPARIAVEFTEYVLLCLVIPFAAWAVGLYTFVRLH